MHPCDSERYANADLRSARQWVRALVLAPSRRLLDHVRGRSDTRARTGKHRFRGL